MAEKNNTTTTEDEAVPVTDEVVTEFLRERQERILARRARIGDRTARKNEALRREGSVSSSLDFLSLPGEEKSGSGGVEAGGSAGKGKAPRRSSQGQGHAQGQGQAGRSSVAQGAGHHDFKRTATDLLDTQIDESRRQLEQIILDGECLITNVKVAAECREKVRQVKESETKKERVERLNSEAQECQQMYEELKPNFDMTSEKKLPTDLFDEIKNHMQACEEIIMKKQDLIETLEQELEENDFNYEDNLLMYQRDVSIMGDRIDDSVDELQQAFLNELSLIEDYTCKNREVILEENQREFKELLEDFETMEEANLEQRKKDALNKFRTLNELFVTVKQECRANKHKFDEDMRILIQELEQIKYATQLNMEKLQYNLAIIRKRHKENVDMKNMMKKLILKFNDRLTEKSRALKKKMEDGRKEAKKILGEISKLEGSLEMFGRKTLHLAMTDWNKYMDLWIVSEEMVKERVQQLLDSEKYIFETQLGMDSPMPQLSFMEERPEVVAKFINKKKLTYAQIAGKGNDDNSRQSRNPGDGTKSKNTSAGDDTDASLTFDESKRKQPCKHHDSLLLMPSDSIEFVPGPEPDPKIQRRLMRHIAKVICDESGFLVEEELRKLVEPLLETERNLVNLDALLKSLGITSVDEMQYLAHFLLRRCRVTKGIISRIGSQASAHLSEMNVSVTGIPGKSNEEGDTSAAISTNLDSSVPTQGNGETSEAEAQTIQEPTRAYSELMQAGEVLDQPPEKAEAEGQTEIEAWQPEEQDETASTVSIASLDSSSNGSEEFMYIKPNEVIEALTEFCKEYNAKITIELPTLDELIDKKLATFKYPRHSTIVEYWEKPVRLLSTRSEDFWEGVLYSFEEFYSSLKKRNLLVDEVAELYRSNCELGFLMKNHFSTASRRFLPAPAGPQTRFSNRYC